MRPLQLLHPSHHFLGAGDTTVCQVMCPRSVASLTAIAAELAVICAEGHAGNSLACINREAQSKRFACPWSIIDRSG
jgi:hypothetical protein